MAAKKKKEPERKGALLTKKEMKELLGATEGSKRSANYPKATKKKASTKKKKKGY